MAKKKQELAEFYQLYYTKNYIIELYIYVLKYYLKYKYLKFMLMCILNKFIKL